MQNITYSLRGRRMTRKGKESSFQRLNFTLDSLGNNLVAILWLAQLALTALQEGADLDRAKQNLQDALQAGDHAKKLIRLALDSQKFDQVAWQEL